MTAHPNTKQPLQAEYDWQKRWIIVTEWNGSDEYGASAIVARDVSPDWALDLLAALSEPERLRAALLAHTPQVRSGPFIVCSCGWAHDDGDGDQWREHVFAVFPERIKA